MPHMRMEDQQSGSRHYQDMERGGSVQRGGGGATQVRWWVGQYVSQHPSVMFIATQMKDGMWTGRELCFFIFAGLVWCAQN